MNKKLIITSLSVALLVAPLAILAFNPGPIPQTRPNLDVNGLVDTLLGFIWPIAVAFFIIMFLLAGFLFLTAQGDPTKVAQARSAVIWGVVGVAVAVLAFSIPFVVRNVLGV